MRSGQFDANKMSTSSVVGVESGVSIGGRGGGDEEDKEGGRSDEEEIANSGDDDFAGPKESGRDETKSDVLEFTREGRKSWD